MDEQNRTDQQIRPYTPPPYRPGQGYSIHLTFGEILAAETGSRNFKTFTVFQILFLVFSALFFYERDGGISFLPLIDPVCLAFSLSALLLLRAAKRVADGSISVGVLVFMRICSQIAALLFLFFIAFCTFFFIFPDSFPITLPYPFEFIFKTPLTLVLTNILLFLNFLAFRFLAITARSLRVSVERNAYPDLPSHLPLTLFLARLPIAPLFFLSYLLRTPERPAFPLSAFYLAILLTVLLLGILRLLFFTSFYRDLERRTQNAYFPQK